MDPFPEPGTALQRTRWVRDQLRGLVPGDELDAVTRRAYELEKAVANGRRTAQRDLAAHLADDATSEF